MIPAESLHVVRDLKTEFDQYLEHELYRAPETRRNYRFCLERVERFAGAPIEDVVTAPDSSQVLRAFKRWAHAHYRPGTIMTTIAAVHAFHDFGVVEGYWTPQPVRAVKAPPVRRQVKPSLSPQDALAFLAAAERPNELRVIWLGLYVGTRVSESARMDESCLVDHRLRFASSKTGLIREVPVHPTLAPRLEEILATSPVDRPRALEYALHCVKGRLGMDWIGPTGVSLSTHVFRRTFASQLLEADVPLWMVEALMGHQSSSMTLSSYAAIPYWKKAEAIRELDYSKSGQMRFW